MAEPTAVEIAGAIVDRSILTKWWFYLIWLVVTAVGAALGVWLKEKVKGDITKDVWLAQESWREKYRIYTVLINETEEIVAALWNITADVRVLAQMPHGQHSSFEDGLRLFPEHKVFLDREQRAVEKIAAVSVGVELMLNKESNEALEKISKARTRTTHVINMSYMQRVEERETAAAEAKEMLIQTAKVDLRI
ncbi:MAG TPA: hypothetical protein VE085_02535 [Burkholderiales bacterium]|nr:hypothetical protein [Burkholderiales bacterium]